MATTDSASECTSKLNGEKIEVAKNQWLLVNNADVKNKTTFQ